ncbi:MAG TPA: AtpZ/AtpI family protein [Vicinamibacterales bacterium]|nr:AtpZ/AtpI family protein [Vicinamibacterales bacterium]
MAAMDESERENESRQGPVPLPDRARKAAAARASSMQALGTLGTVGLTFVVAIVIGVAIGLWLDRLTGWSPLFFIVFFLLGLAAGITNVYRAMSRLPK